MIIRNAVFFFFTFLVLLTSCRVQLPEEKETNQIVTPTSTKKTRPNVILIMADDMGYETININGGNSYRTPNLDRMALNGMRFNHCYSQPICTPSRVKIMTGISNVRNYVEFGMLDTSQTTFGNLFEDAGYSTCIIGKWQLGRDDRLPEKFGFQEHCLWQLTTGRVDSEGRDTRFSAPHLTTNKVLKEYDRKDYGPKIVSDFGLDFIERSVNKDKPFLLYYPMILTHCPFSPTPDSKSWMTNDTSVQTYKGDPEYFGDMMSYTDKIVGRINAKLEELEIEDNTIVIFTGDNGTDKPIVSYMYGREVAGAKGTSTDAGCRVPLFVKWPGTIQQGTLSNNLVDFSDVLPTICEAANITVPKTPVIDGKSFLPLLKGKDHQPRNWIYNWYSRNGDEENKSVFARNQRFKLYKDGRFYEVPNDYLEQRPISKEKLNIETSATYEMLDGVLKSYAGKRLENISENK